jgi:peptidoglycan/LPS O-acetylase OafA/YrhL
MPVSRSEPDSLLTGAVAPDSVPSDQSSIKTGRLAVIDEWRGLSVLLVISHHFAIFRFRAFLETDYRLNDFLHRPSIGTLKQAAARMFYQWAHGVGPLGVQIFFVISGFVITRLLIAENDRTGRICVRCFYIRRVFRIIPALALFLAFIVLINALGFISVPRSDFLAASTFLCNTTLVNCGYYFGHLWSLSIEEQFYLVWPWLFLLLGIRFRSPAILAVFALCMAFSLVPSFRIGWLNNGLSFGCIAAGAAYALSDGVKMFFKPCARVPIWLGAAALVLVLPLFRSFPPGPRALGTLITPFLIVAVVLTRAEKTPALNGNSVVWGLRQVGLFSYSLYLWHYMFTLEPGSYRSQGFLFASIPVGIVFAWFSGRYMEPMFIRMGRKLAHRVSDDENSWIAAPATLLPVAEDWTPDEAQRLPR